MEQQLRGWYTRNAQAEEGALERKNTERESLKVKLPHQRSSKGLAMTGRYIFY